MTSSSSLRAREQNMPNAPEALTDGAALRLFLPLSLSDVIMVVAGPVLTMGLTRLAAPETSLAAYSVAQNVSILLESPIIMLLHASTALNRYRGLYRPLRRFMILANLAITLFYLGVAFTPLYDVLFRTILGQPPAVVAAARPAFQLMLLWPAAIGWRRFYQGVLINHRQTSRVALAGFARLGSLTLVVVLGVLLRLPGAALAGLALVTSVIAEAAAVTLFSRPHLLHGEPAAATAEPPDWAPQNVRSIALWYWPLAMTQVLVWIVQPFINGGIARTISPEIGLAAWPVAWSTIGMVANSTRAVQQLALSLLHTRQHYLVLRRFVWEAGIAAAGLMALLAYTPLGFGYMRWVLGLTGDLEALALAALPALRLALIYPILMAQQNWLQGLLIRGGQPRWVNGAAIAGGAATLTVAYLGALVWRLPGAPLGTLSMMAGSLMEVAVLLLVSRSQREGWLAAE